MKALVEFDQAAGAVEIREVLVSEIGPTDVLLEIRVAGA